MSASDNTNHWIETNQKVLSEELAWLRHLLESSVDTSMASLKGPPDTTSFTLDFLSDQFRLTSFERSIILLCAGIELHSDMNRLCSTVHGNDRNDYPTFGLALAVLPEAHWNALSPDAPLRYWQLLRVSDPAHITTTRLTLDERILHFLLGTGNLDQGLTGLVRPLSQGNPLPITQNVQMERLCSLWSDSNKLPVILIQGDDPLAGHDVAAHSCGLLGFQPLLMQAFDIPAAANERSLLARLLTREYLLSRTALLIDGLDNPPPHLRAFIEQLHCPLMLLGNRPAALQCQSAIIEINKPSTGEQRSLWHRALNDEDAFDEAELLPLAAQFNFSSVDIATTAESVQTELKLGTPWKQALWQHCRQHSRGGLDHLAQRISPRAGWDDLILPGGQKNILHDISRQVRHRTTVYEAWGFADKCERGLGISALFTGESGTGKTMAAEVLAADLNLDLYRIDLSAVVSKYIGETEKNLERLFSEAETSGAILLFDEADALFGKRSDVKDSHDRYANIELAYLLQRMESYRGLSILTSNMKSALDTAFLRRIRFVVQFPYPDAAQRSEIWQRIFPDKLPCAELKTEQLARLHVAGGNIRNIAMNAAFLAAEKGNPLCMEDLAHAARMEYAKLEKPLNESELRTWI
ncbi:MAG: ATP-binding protein [Gammaproteobacteria bacterium]|nr:ATP-binding protein [Gammaproteobacteria bacterium]